MTEADLIEVIKKKTEVSFIFYFCLVHRGKNKYSDFEHKLKNLSDVDVEHVL